VRTPFTPPPPLMYTNRLQDELRADVGVSATAYGLGAGLSFIGYALFEVPSNMLLERFGARVWLTRIMITWGLVIVAMCFIHSVWMFYALRFLLGVAEAGFFPGVLLCFTDLPRRGLSHSTWTGSPEPMPHWCTPGDGYRRWTPCSGTLRTVPCSWMPLPNCTLHEHSFVRWSRHLLSPPARGTSSIV
jgi:hypothetical protein